MQHAAIPAELRFPVSTAGMTARAACPRLFPAMTAGGLFRSGRIVRFGALNGRKRRLLFLLNRSITLFLFLILLSSFFRSRFWCRLRRGFGSWLSPWLGFGFGVAFVSVSVWAWELALALVSESVLEWPSESALQMESVLAVAVGVTVGIWMSLGTDVSTGRSSSDIGGLLFFRTRSRSRFRGNQLGRGRSLRRRRGCLRPCPPPPLLSQTISCGLAGLLS